MSNNNNNNERILWACESCNFKNDSLDLICCNCNHNNQPTDILPSRSTTIEGVTNDGKKIIKKKIIVKKKVTKNNSNYVPPDDLDDLTASAIIPSQSMADIAFDQSMVDFQAEEQKAIQEEQKQIAAAAEEQKQIAAALQQQKQIQDQQQHEEQQKRQEEQQRDQDECDFVDTVDLPPIFNEVLVTIQQDAKNALTAQIEKDKAMGPLAQLAANYKTLTVYAISFWVTTIIWLVLYAIRSDQHWDPQTATDNEKLMHNARYLFWWISTILYLTYLIMFCPFLDQFLKRRKHKYCEYLYTLDESIRHNNVSPVTFTEQLRNFIFMNPALMSAQTLDKSNTFLCEGTILNNRGTDAEINYPGIDIIKELNVCDKLVFSTVVIHNTFGTVNDQCKIIQYLSNTTGYPITLQNISFANQNFAGVDIESQDKTTKTTMRITYVVLPPKLTEGSESFIKANNNNNNNNNSGNDESLLSNTQDSSDFTPKRKLALPFFYRALLSTPVHFFSYALALEPIYLIVYFANIANVKIRADRVWTFIQGNERV